MALAFYAFERWRAASAAAMNRWLWRDRASRWPIRNPAAARAGICCAAAIVPAMTLDRLAQHGTDGAATGACWSSMLTLLPLVPWTALRNWRVFHVFQPLAPRSATDPGESHQLRLQRWYPHLGHRLQISTDELLLGLRRLAALRSPTCPTAPSIRTPSTRPDQRPAQPITTSTDNPSAVLDARFDAIGRGPQSTQTLCATTSSYPWRASSTWPSVRAPRFLPIPAEWWKFVKPDTGKD